MLRSPPLLLLGRLLQEPQSSFPESGQVIPELSKPFRPRSVESPRSVSPLVYQPCLPQHAQVLRNGWPRDSEVGGDSACRQLGVAHELEDLEAAWPRESPECLFHGN